MATDTTSFYTAVGDNILSTFDTTVSIDKSIERKSVRNIPPTNSSTLQSSFNFSMNTSNTRTRWDTTFLQFKVKISAADKVSVATNNVSPAWNAVAELIDSIRLGFNSSGSDIYSVSNGYFLPCFTSRLLRYYSITELNKKDYLFTPIAVDGLTDEYIMRRPTAAEYSVGTTLYDSEGLPQHILADADPAVAGALAVGVNPLTAAAIVSPTRFPAAYQRYLKYVKVNPTNGADTNVNREIIVKIPFCELFPRMIGCFKNVRSVQIDVNYKSSVALERHSSSDLISDGILWYIPGTCKVITDDYILSTGESAVALESKLTNGVDNISILRPNIQEMVFNSGDLIISAKRNLESVMIMQFANKCISGNADTAAFTSSSTGQFYLFNSETVGATQIERRIYSKGIVSADQKLPPSTVQIAYGNLLYPETPISLVSNNSFDATGIYYEYNKASGKIGDRLTGSLIPFDTYQSTMPIIWLKPFTGSAAHLSDAQDILIKFGSNSITFSKDKSFYAIVYELVSFRVNVDGTVQTTL